MTGGERTVDRDIVSLAGVRQQPWSGRLRELLPRGPGGRRQSPASGSHRTLRADFPHYARQKAIYSVAIACSSR